MTRKALIVGASGIIGSATAEVLRQQGWQVWGLARNPIEGAAVPVAADLMDPVALADAVTGIDPSHVFISSWLRQSTEAENIRVNSIVSQYVV
jgi:uncharacterized protein YbjT (DUF2867 family)